MICKPCRDTHRATDCETATCPCQHQPRLRTSALDSAPEPAETTERDVEHETSSR